MRKRLWIAAGLMSLSLTVNAMAAYDQGVVKEVQEALNAAGFDCGTPDGLAGEKTKAAVSAYQEQNGIEVTGEISKALLDALGLNTEDSVAGEVTPAEEAAVQTEATADLAIKEGELSVPPEVMELITSMSIIPPAEKADIPLEPVQNDIGEKKSEYYEYYNEGEVQSKITTYYQYDENGLLQAETETTHFVGNDDWPDTVLGTVYTYDENGNKTITAHYDYGNWAGEGMVAKLRSYTAMSYDSAGNKTAEVSFKESGDIGNYDIFLLDENGNKSKEYTKGAVYSSSEGSKDYTSMKEIETDDKGNVLHETLTESTKSDDKPGSSVEYTYDDEDRLLTKITYDSENNILEQEEYTYSAEGYSERYQDNENNYYSISEYDKNDNEISFNSFNLDDDSPLSVSEYTYDENGNLLDWIMIRDGTQDRHRVLEYDDLGHLIKETCYDGPDEILLYTTEYTY